MGLGDWIMATGQVAAMYEKDRTPVLVVDRIGRTVYNEIFFNNPKILAAPLKQGRFAKLCNASGNRPYILMKTARRWYWRSFDIRPGEFYFTKEELLFGKMFGGRVVIEPNTKGTNEGNKDWGFERWQAVVSAHEPTLFIQVGPANARRLEGVEFVETTNFRLAAAVLAHSRAFVGAEGGLHHAAAAVSTPAVVLFGGFISPDITGYPTHKNLFTGGTACGSRYACAHCRTAMSRITPEDVSNSLKEILDEIRA